MENQRAPARYATGNELMEALPLLEREGIQIPLEALQGLKKTLAENCVIWLLRKEEDAIDSPRRYLPWWHLGNRYGNPLQWRPGLTILVQRHIQYFETKSYLIWESGKIQKPPGPEWSTTTEYEKRQRRGGGL